MQIHFHFVKQGYYPNLIGLYDWLGVSYRSANFSYSFSHLALQHASTPTTNSNSDYTTTKAEPEPELALRPHLIYEGASGRAGIGIPRSWLDGPSWLDAYLPPPPSASPSPAAKMMNFAPKYTPSTSPFSIVRIEVPPHPLIAWLVIVLRLVLITAPRALGYILHMLLLLYHFIRLHILSLSMLTTQSSTETLREWTVRTTPTNSLARTLGLDEKWSEFVESVVVPLFSCVCTCEERDVWSAPVHEVLGALLFVLGFFVPLRGFMGADD